MTSYVRLFRRRSFALLWLGATLSTFGDALTWVALVWLTLELGGTPIQVGVLAACYTGPVIIGGLGAGILLDRFDRRRLLILDNLVRGLAMASVPVAAGLDVLTQAQLYLVAAVYGLLYMVSLAGFPAVIPDLVEPDDLSTANALESISYGVGGVVGPIVAGILIGFLGAASVLALDALTYFAFVGCLAMIAIPRSAASAGVGASSVLRDGGLRPAVRFVRRSPPILAITLMFMAFNVGEGMLTVLLPVYARDVLLVGAAGYGVLVSSLTIGQLAGSIVVGGVRWPWPLGRSIAAAQLLAGISIVGLAVAPGLAASAAVLVAFGLLVSPLTIWAQTIRLRLIPAELRGRVMSLLRTLMQSTPPVGGLLAGQLLSAGATAPALTLIGVLGGLPGAVGLVHRSMARTATEAPGPTAVRSAVAEAAQDDQAGSHQASEDQERKPTVEHAGDGDTEDRVAESGAARQHHEHGERGQDPEDCGRDETDRQRERSTPASV
jgi:MFS family permease